MMAQLKLQTSQYEFLFGGTFDPIHLGHLAIIKALQQLAPELSIRLLPCAIPPLKQQPLTSYQQRIEMLELALAEELSVAVQSQSQTGSAIDNISIDQREQKRQRASYTMETLQELQQDFPHNRFILVVGSDSLHDLPRWYQWRKLSGYCHLLVLNRPGYQIDELKTRLSAAGFDYCKNFQNLTKQPAGLGFCLKMPEMSQSSSEIRRLIRNNQSLDSMLSKSVIEYIHKKAIYQ